MRSLTLAARTLREDQRGHVQWVLRSVLVAVILVVLIADFRSRNLVGASGRGVFEALVWVNFWFLALVAPTSFSSVITEEKEQGTLGLLELAGFGAPSILLGKSVGELCSTALLLAVQLPFAMLTVTLGGVSQHQVFAAFAQLAAFTAAVYGLALLSSVVCPRSAGATRMTLWLVGAMTFGAWLIELVLELLAPSRLGNQRPVWLDLLEQVSTAGALSAITATGFDRPLLTTSVLVSLGIGAVAALLAALWFSRATARDVRAAPPRARWSWLVGHRGRPGPGARAVSWREFHFVGLGQLGLWLRSGAVAAILAVSVYLAGVRGKGPPIEVVLMALPWMFLLFVLDACMLAARVFHEELRWHTLHGLFTLPIPLRTWAGAKVRGAARLLLPSSVGLVLTVLMAVADTGGFAIPVLLFALPFVGGMVLFVVHLAAYLSLRMRRGAVATAVAACLAVNVMLVSCAFSAGPPLFCLLPGVGLGMAAISVRVKSAILRRLREHGS